jgi:hypothetical protein
MPVQHRHIGQMAQRAGRIEHRHGVKAHLLARPGIDVGPQRGGDHLRAEADAQRGAIRRQTPRQLLELAGNPRILRLFINPHRPAHHDQQIRLAQVERREGRIGDIDAVDKETRAFDRLAIAGHAFMRHMADDERLAAHRATSG